MDYLCRYCGFKSERLVEIENHNCTFLHETSDEVYKIKYKYREDKIIEDFKQYIDRTYKEHYHNNNISCFDAWISMGDATSTFRNTAMKYLWRLKKKEDTIPRDDLMKTMHYVLMCLYNEYYRIEN